MDLSFNEAWIYKDKGTNQEIRESKGNRGVMMSMESGKNRQERLQERQGRRY